MEDEERIEPIQVKVVKDKTWMYTGIVLGILLLVSCIALSFSYYANDRLEGHVTALEGEIAMQDNGIEYLEDGKRIYELGLTAVYCSDHRTSINLLEDMGFLFEGVDCDVFMEEINNVRTTT